MKGKFNFKVGALCAILSAMLVMPALGQVKEEEGSCAKEQKDQIIKELKLAPEKEKAVLAVGDIVCERAHRYHCRYKES